MFFRTIYYLLVAILIITLLRYVIGSIGRALSGLFAPPDSGSGTKQAAGPRDAGELKRDPVCGTFVPVASSVTKAVGGEVVHFCSAACRDKYRHT